jgi:hypothetical protein
MRRPFVRLALAATAAAGLSIAAPSLAAAKVHITVDLDRQTIHVEAPDQVFDWKVSSGKFGHETPSGKYGVLWMDKDHHSDEYDQAPMPNAIFFAPGYAIHGAYKSQWGHSASHGCVRLPVAKSAILFDLVKAQGADVTITGYSPANADTVAAEVAKRKADKLAVAATAPGTPVDDPGYQEAVPVAPPAPRSGPLDALFSGLY